jgi:DNA-directed RNA polymerase specialized sigma24 family protein
LGKHDFRDLPEYELQRLTDDELIEHIRAASVTGRHEAGKRALAILVFGYIDLVTARVRLKVPRQDVEDVAADTLASAISAFDGHSVGEFRGWLHRIVARRIADYHRRREGKPELVPLDRDDEGDDDDRRPTPGPWVEPEHGAVPVRQLVDVAYGELRPEHQRVVDLFVFDDLPAAEAAARIPAMTVANVHQVASRFRRRVRELLEDGDTSP